MDGIEIQALLLRNKLADIIQDEFAREMNYLVCEEARRCCEGCQIDDPSQMHHDCMMKEEEEIWICHYEEAKKHLKLDKVWSAIEEEIHKKIRCLSGGLMVKVLFYLVKVEDTSVYLMYKNFERKQNQKQKTNA